jgi:serine/threonine-protein kinase HipA
MMISKPNDIEAYVWVWLPNKTEPVVAGKVVMDGKNILFAYGRSYLERPDAISLYDPELPLMPGTLPLPNGLSIPSSIRDAAPDAWGRRVIINRLMGLKGDDAEQVDLNEITYLLESGSDRIGALDFQVSATKYTPRQTKGATLEDLMQSAKRVEEGIPLTPELDQALFHGSSIGGARPKALIQDDNIRYIAKFSASNDTYSVVKAEFIAMRLAKLAGIDVAEVKMVEASGKDVLLIERFDRVQTNNGVTKKLIISALTILALDEMMARYASYQELAEIIRKRFSNPKTTLKELFSRLVFNILCGNNDDHARNHAAFWDGQSLTLTPAYDLCPQNRTGNLATQAMLIIEENNYSKLSVCMDAAYLFLLNETDAKAIIKNQISIIENNWVSICDEAKLSEVDRKLFWKRQLLNPFAFEGFEA